MKILLGGIPLGCDNIGDEAIIACVVKMLKDSLPGVELTVATADPGTADRLGVAVAPLYGFTPAPFPTSQSPQPHNPPPYNAYIWCGATGLSDYPHVGLSLLEAAQNAGIPTFVWGVGMDDELNPVFFKAHGKHRVLLKSLGLVGWYEQRLRTRLARRISRVLPRCKGVWLRDPQSAAMLASMGFAGAKVAADSAILFASPEPRTQNPEPGTQNPEPGTQNPEPGTPNPEPPTLGLCISTQRQVADLAGLRRLIAAVRESGAKVLGIPMNVKTDRALLERLGVECIPGTTPESVVEASAQCNVVLSSRLHLLILAADAGTPGLGIARGSKLANWLANFGECVVGSVYDCNWGKVTERVLGMLKDSGNWSERRVAAYGRLNARLESARRDLVAKILDCAK